MYGHFVHPDATVQTHQSQATLLKIQPTVLWLNGILLDTEICIGSRAANERSVAGKLPGARTLVVQRYQQRCLFAGESARCCC